MRKEGKFHGSLLSAVMILVILFTALGEKGISAKAETSEKEEVKENLKELWKDYHDMVLYTLSRSGHFLGQPFEKAEVYRVSAEGNVYNSPAGLEKLGNLREKDLRSILQR